MKKGGIDPAALAGATLASALTVFGPEGSYKSPSMIIGITLVFFLLGYDVKPERRISQSLAFGLVFGLCCMLVLGFPLEWFFSKGNIGKDSNIPNWAVFTVWAVGSCIFFLIDTIRADRPKDDEGKG